MIMLLKIKAYLFFGIGLLVSGLLVTVKVLAGRNSRLNTKLERADARIHHAKVVIQKERETEAELRSRTANLAKELEEKKTSSELEKPNEW